MRCACLCVVLCTYLPPCSHPCSQPCAGTLLLPDTVVCRKAGFFIVSQVSWYISFVRQVSSYEPCQSSFNWPVKLVIPVLAYPFDCLWGTRVRGWQIVRSSQEKELVEPAYLTIQLILQNGRSRK